MSIETMTKLATTTLSTSTASVTFSNIPQTYTDLRIVVSGRTTGGVGDSSELGTISFSFGSTSYTYSDRFLGGNGTAAYSSANSVVATSTPIYWLNGSGSTASTFASVNIDIPNYTLNNAKNISYEAAPEYNNSTLRMMLGTILTTKTDPVTQIVLTAGQTAFATHSTFTLYGIKAYRLAVPNPPAVPPISGYSLWLDASNLGSIKYSTSNNISQWNDLSGNNNNAVQANAALQPTFEQSVLNNKPVVRFNATKLLKTGTRFGGQTQTVFMVINTASGIDSGTTGAGSPLYSSLGQVSNLIAGGMAFGNWTGGYSGERINWTVQTSGNSTNGVAYTTANISPGGHTLCFSTGSSGSGRDIKLDNSSLSLTAVDNWTTTNYPGNYDCIGNTDSATDGFRGDIAELIFYPTQLSTSQITAVHTYLKAKWRTL